MIDINEILGRIGFDFRIALFSVINFLIVFYVLKRYLFDSLTKIIVARETELEVAKKMQEEARSELANAEANANEIVTNARSEAAQIIDRAKESGEKLVEERKAEAEAEVESMHNRAEKEIATERKQMASRLRKETAAVVTEAVKTLVGKNVDTETDAALVEKSLAKLGDK